MPPMYLLHPDVLTTPEQPDNYNDDNSNGLAPQTREVSASSRNYLDICWSTFVYDDLLMAQVSPRVTLESHDAFTVPNDLHAPIFLTQEMMESIVMRLIYVFLTQQMIESIVMRLDER